MSYGVTIPTPHGRDDARKQLDIATFCGAEDNRKMVQITIGDKYVQLTTEDVDIVLDKLRQARDHRLADTHRRSLGDK